MANAVYVPTYVPNFRFEQKEICAAIGNVKLYDRAKTKFFEREKNYNQIFF